MYRTQRSCIDSGSAFNFGSCILGKNRATVQQCYIDGNSDSGRAKPSALTSSSIRRPMSSVCGSLIVSEMGRLLSSFTRRISSSGHSLPTCASSFLPHKAAMQPSDFDGAAPMLVRVRLAVKRYKVPPLSLVACRLLDHDRDIAKRSRHRDK